MKNILNAITRFLLGLRRPSKAANTRLLHQRGETLQSLVIRDATHQDIPALAELHVKTWSDTLQYADFNIGLEFHTAAGRWRCTDTGTRVIVAIRLDAPDASWYTGPPYAVAETVLDENDLEGCSLDALAVAVGIK